MNMENLPLPEVMIATTPRLSLRLRPFPDPENAPFWEPFGNLLETFW